MAQIGPLIRTILLLALIAAGPPASAEIWIIATRANNIHCEVGDDPQKAGLMCNIFRRVGPPAQAKPEDCTASWGHAYYISERGPVQMLCFEKWSNDWPGNGKFKDAEAANFGGIACKATRNTLECSNLDGHGFFLSRKVQKVF